MGSPATAPERRRRTQAERRRATRTALLDATIACLVEQGYASTTTRRIAERAEVSPGALQHHFAGKAELLGEAIRHVWAELAQQVLADGPPSAPSIPERTEQLLDRMWELHRGPLFQASMELLLGARTDDELRPTLAQALREVANWNAVGAPILFPEVADQQGFARLIATGQAAIRGLAMLAFVDEAAADAIWPAMRTHILGLGIPYIGDSEPSP